MEREIKFRVWDTFNEKMVESPFMFEKAAEHDRIEGDKRFDAPYTYSEDWRDWEDGIRRPCYVMQFTGLRDKAGKEVFEGDIVECEYWLPSRYKIGFIEGGFCLCHLKTGEWVADVTHMEDSTGKHFSVIGNIYSNPELTAK